MSIKLKQMAFKINITVVNNLLHVVQIVHPWPMDNTIKGVMYIQEFQSTRFYVFPEKGL